MKQFNVLFKKAILSRANAVLPWRSPFRSCLQTTGKWCWMSPKSFSQYCSSWLYHQPYHVSAWLLMINRTWCSTIFGSLGAEAFISSMNLTASIKKIQARTKNDWKVYQGHICKASTKFKNFLKHNVKDGNFKKILNTNIKNGDVPQRLIIPIVRGPPDIPGHFFVACFDFSVDDPKFFVIVCFYDSLERARKRILHRSSTAA